MTRMKMIWSVLSGIVALGLICCASGKKPFELGMQMQADGNYREAIGYMQDAVAAEPKNEKYRMALAEAKSALISELIHQADEILTSQIPSNSDTISAAGAKIAEARQLGPENPAVRKYTDRLLAEQSALEAAVSRLYAEANKAIDNMQWQEAHTKLQQIDKLYPGYEDSERLSEIVITTGAPALLKKGIEYFDQQDYKRSAKYLQKALTIDPQLEQAQTYLQLCRERDTKKYFFEQGNRALQDGKWKLAERSYRRALTYEPGNQEVREALKGLRYNATFHYLRKTRTHMSSGYLFNAFVSYDLALQNADIDKHPQLKSHLTTLGNELGAAAGAVAEKFAAENRYGSAWFWFQKIKKVDPGYPNLFYRSQAMEDSIIERLRKSMAVFDFGSPSTNLDAGVIFASRLNTFLFKNANKVIKIVERERLQPLLEELQQGQVGLLPTAAARRISRLHGIDAALGGKVLRYSVDSSSHSVVRSVTYKIKKTEENIEYLNWKARNPNPTKEQLELAPVPFIHRMVDREKQYEVTTHKKVALVTVTFHVVDGNTGEIILVDTILRSKTVADETSAGVPTAGIPYDPLEIPTDTELLQELASQVIGKIGEQALQPFEKLEKTYFRKAEKYLKRRENIVAAEYFTDTVFTEMVNKVDAAPLTPEANRHLDNIFRSYKVTSEG